MVGIGFGKFPSPGAVYVNTFDPLDDEITHVPILPPFTVPPELHDVAFVGVGFGTTVVGSGVYTYVHVHCTVNVVEPPTVAVNENTWPATTVADAGLTVTVTTFTPLLPQPAAHIPAHITANSAAPFIHRDFITDVSPVLIRGIPTALPCSISMPSGHSCVVLRSPLLPWLGNSTPEIAAPLVIHF
jgi:hypothetical protein